MCSVTSVADLGFVIRGHKTGGVGVSFRLKAIGTCIHEHGLRFLLVCIESYTESYTT